MCPARSTEDEGRVVIRDLDGVDAVVVGLLLAPAVLPARAAAVLAAAAPVLGASGGRLTARRWSMELAYGRHEFRRFGAFPEEGRSRLMSERTRIISGDLLAFRYSMAGEARNGRADAGPGRRVRARADGRDGGASAGRLRHPNATPNASGGRGRRLPRRRLGGGNGGAGNEGDAGGALAVEAPFEGGSGSTAGEP